MPSPHSSSRRPADGQRRHVARQRGQAIVEFALISPLLFLLMVGILDFGRAVADYVALSHVTFEGARIAGMMPAATGTFGSDPNDQAATYAVIGVIQSQGGILDPVSESQVTVTDGWCPSNIDSTRECRTVAVTKVFVPFTPIIQNLTGQFNMQKTVVAVVQN
jgi:Flp pilus assembly protein TadG